MKHIPEEVQLTDDEREALRGLGQGQVPAVVKHLIAERVAQARAEALAPVLALINAPYGSEQWGHLRDGVRYIEAAHLHRALDSRYRVATPSEEADRG